MALTLTLAHPDGDLVIPGRPDPVALGHGAWVTQLTLPNRAWRRQYAPDSPSIPGKALLTATLEAAPITALVTIKAPTSAELGDELGHLEEVLAQYSYDVSTTTETRTQTWSAEPADISYGAYSVGADRMASIQLALSIPASPI